MTQKRYQHLEHLEGVGEAVDESGTSVGDAVYYLDVFQEINVIRTLTSTSSVPGLKRVEGRIDGLDTFRLLGESLTLRLKDGRTLPFFIQNDRGRIAARGGISGA